MVKLWIFWIIFNIVLFFIPKSATEGSVLILLVLMQFLRLRSVVLLIRRFFRMRKNTLNVVHLFHSVIHTIIKVVRRLRIGLLIAVYVLSVVV